MTTIRCSKCGGVISGYYENTADFMGCRCLPEPEPIAPLMGWECPRCHKIHSPFVTECSCMPFIITSISNPTIKEATE